mgnify:CR=1 FL=1
MPIITEVDLLKHRRTKIIATLGPASDQPEIIHGLINAGVNVVRLNMSHGDHTSHAATFARVREAAQALKQPIAILADLCGPKIRTGAFEHGQMELATGSKVIVTTRDIIGSPGIIPSQYDALATDVQPSTSILLDDGRLKLQVISVAGTEISCSVVDGGTLKNHTGINLPNTDLSAPSLTTKDRDDVEFALNLGVDFLALSFVRRASDIEELRALVEHATRSPALIAKIENPEALEHASDIIAATDAIMVARGDLGVELNPEQVPLAQRQLIDMSRAANKPVIVATQMLESMIENPRPTRAEVTDVSAAVSMGADAIMLSGETAAGAYPIQAVTMMDRIARQSESYFLQHSGSTSRRTRGAPDSPVPFGDAIADAAARLVYDLQARAVLVISRTGMSAVTVSAARPPAPVVGITGDADTCRRMNLMWGLIPVVADDVRHANANEIARRTARDLGLAADGQRLLLVRGFSSAPQYNTPSITILNM